MHILTATIPDDRREPSRVVEIGGQPWKQPIAYLVRTATHEHLFYSHERVKAQEYADANQARLIPLGDQAPEFAESDFAPL